jgi:hypothetical protein
MHARVNHRFILPSGTMLRAANPSRTNQSPFIWRAICFSCVLLAASTLLFLRKTEQLAATDPSRVDSKDVPIPMHDGTLSAQMSCFTPSPAASQHSFIERIFHCKTHPS